jgi:hypothetical protein
MIKQQFRHLGTLPSNTPIDGFPHRVFVILKVEDDLYSMTDQGLENPASIDLFFVHREVEPDTNNWICEARGKIFLAAWVMQDHANYKGASFMDTGYVYFPYVPVPTAMPMDIESFTYRKGILTRYGKKLLAEGAKYSGVPVPKPKKERRMRAGEKLFVGAVCLLGVVAMIAYMVR